MPSYVYKLAGAAYCTFQTTITVMHDKLILNLKRCTRSLSAYENFKLLSAHKTIQLPPAHEYMYTFRIL